MYIILGFDGGRCIVWGGTCILNEQCCLQLHVNKMARKQPPLVYVQAERDRVKLLVYGQRTKVIVSLL